MTVVFYRHLEYGKVVLIWLAHMPFVLVADPEAVKVCRTYLQKKNIQPVLIGHHSNASR